METSITKLLIKSRYYSHNSSGHDLTIRLVPKYFGTIFTIGLDRQDIVEEREALFVSLLRIDEEITYTNRSTAKLYKFLLDNFNSSKVIYVRTKFGTFCTGKGLLIAGVQLLAISVYMETIDRVFDSGYKTLLEFDKNTHVYMTLPNTKNERHVKELYNYIKDALPSYHVSNFNFTEWL